MKRFWLFLLLVVIFPDVLWSQQSQFGNDFVLAGATCPPVNPPAHTGTLYTCTGTGALYTWTGSAWVEAGGGGGTIGGTIASTQVAIGSGADTISGNAFTLASTTTGHLGLGSNAAIDSGAMNAWATVNAIIGIQNNRTTLPSGIQTSIFNSSDLTPAADVVGARRFTGQYNDIEFLGTHNAANTEFYGHLTDVTMNGAGTALWAFGNQSAVYVFDNQGNITQVYGANHYIYSQSLTGNITDAYGVSAYPMQHYGGGTVTNSHGVYVWPVAGSGTITNNYGIWVSAQERAASCSYDFWADEQGVFRIRADTTFNSVTQAIPALYNPQFTKYTPCATNHERVVLQWESNVATLTTEKGGTGTLRALNLGDTGVQVQINAKNITLSGNLTTTGAFNPTFAIPSSSTWTFPSGGGTLLTSVGTAMTGPVVITEAVGSSALTLTGATQVTSFPVLNATQTWNASGTTFTAVKVNVTSTASAAASLLMDLQVGNSSQATISKGGNILGAVQTGGSGSNVAVGIAAGRGMWTGGGSQLDFAAGSNTLLTITQTASTLLVPSDGAIGFGPNTTTASSVGSTISVAFARDAANAMALRNGANAQTFNTYSTYTSATNNEYFNVLWSSSVLHLGTNKGSGGGTARVMQIDYGGTTTPAISVPITSGTVTFGGSTTANYYIGNGTGLTVANVGVNSCGTSAATVAGGSSSFEVTVGATSGTQCRVTLPTAAPTRWNCAPSNTSTAALVRAANVDTTNVDLLGVFTAGDVISVVCVPR